MKKKLFIILLFIGMIPTLQAQFKTCDCRADLEYLNKKIKKLPSYKRNKSAYKEVYNTALTQTSSETPYYDCLEILNEVLVPLKDWHMGVIEKAHDSTTISTVTYPTYSGSLDSLTNYLQKVSFNEIEGIYHTNKELSLGVIYNEKEDVYNAVILTSSSTNWAKGDVVYKFIPLKDNYFKIVGAQYPSKRLISYHERINDGVVLRAGFKKDTLATYFTKNPYPDQTYLFKELSPEIDYLKAGSFNSNYPILKDAEDFYSTLEGKLTKPHLILDLRDNGGGGDRNSNILYKQLKKYVKKNKIYVITNASTGSNAEQFTVKLKKFDNVITYGDITRGALSYELKSKDYHTLPSSNFLAILPSKAHKKYLKYETKGITPDYLLDYRKNWISAVREKIETKK